MSARVPTMLTVFVLLCLAVTVSARDAIVASTQYGKVRGFVHKTNGDFNADVFLGIPFAAPPLGELKFQKPEPPLPWDDVRDAKTFASPCAALPLYGKSMLYTNASEDCLYLNVFAPSIAARDAERAKFPVLVFLHGGGFNAGSSIEYGFAGPAEQLVARGVVLVIPQYRLGPWGFLATESGDAAGNMGLWDQVEALKWISENVGNFGGDPSRVTLAGQSAGAASTSILALSDSSYHLFNQVVQMSGSAWCPFALSMAEKVQANSRTLAERVGCSVASGHKMLACLRAVTQQSIVDAATAIATDGPLDLFAFAPIYDDELVTSTPGTLIEAAPPKRSLVGITDTEYGFRTCPLGGMPSELRARDGFDETDLERFLRDVLFPESKEEKAAKELQDLARRAYLPPNTPTDEASLVRVYTQMISDKLMNFPVANDVNSKRDLAWPTYLYVFEHFNPAIFDANHRLPGVYHAMELPYVFKMRTFANFAFNEDDVKVAAFTASVITNFVKFGDPTPTDDLGVRWPHVGADGDEWKYLALGAQPRIEDAFAASAFDFWSDTVPNKRWEIALADFDDDEGEGSDGVLDTDSRSAPHAQRTEL